MSTERHNTPQTAGLLRAKRCFEGGFGVRIEVDIGRAPFKPISQGVMESEFDALCLQFAVIGQPEIHVIEGLGDQVPVIFIEQSDIRLEVVKATVGQADFRMLQHFGLKTFGGKGGADQVALTSAQVIHFAAIEVHGVGPVALGLIDIREPG